MPTMSAYPPIQDVMSQAQPTGGGGQQPGAAPGGAPQATTPAEQATNPFLQALKIIGLGIQTAKTQNKPKAAAMSQAFGGLLQAMTGQGAGQQPGVPAQPQPAAPQAAPQPQPTQPPQPAGPPPAPAAGPGGAPPMPQPGAMAQGTAMGQRPGMRPFGTNAGQRPVSKQPVII